MIWTKTILIISVSVVFGESATQTDWSGGPGVLGPVSTWSDAFSDCENLDWSTLSGILILECKAYVHVLVESTYSLSYRGLSIAGFEQDGSPDILGSSFTDGIWWWRNENGFGTSWVSHMIDDSFSANASSLADVDGDGDQDLITGGGSYASLSWWENVDGTGLEWIEHELPDNNITRIDMPLCSCSEY